MIHKTVDDVHQAVRGRLTNNHELQKTADRRDLAGQLIAAFYRCQGCASWWIESDLDTPDSCLAYQLVEPHSDRYLWQDYRGLQRSAAAGFCANCGQKSGEPDCELRYDDQGRVLWPRLQLLEENSAAISETSDSSANPFAAYVSNSEKIGENMFVIAAWEARQKLNAQAYTADINDIRDELDEIRSAFKDAVYGYAPLLPPGWRVTADFDKWLKGHACAGFLHGEIRPDVSLLIGGRCSTIAELEMELDRLFRCVCEMSC